jgi:hypothetical protein
MRAITIGPGSIPQGDFATSIGRRDLADSTARSSFAWLSA